MHTCLHALFFLLLLFIFNTSDTIDMKEGHGLDCSYSLENNFDPSVGSNELFNIAVEGQSNEKTFQTSNTQSFPFSLEDNVSNDSETQNRHIKRNKTAAKQKDNILTNANNAIELVNSSTPDDTAFLAKAILACILIAFFAACALPYHKNANVITLYGKGLVQIWKRLGNIT